MAMNIDNIGIPQVANPAIVALAIDAGIVPLIESLVPLATDRISLLIALKEALGGGANPPNPELAAALNTQVLDAILGYMSSLPGARVVPAERVRRVLDHSGPLSLVAARDINALGQVNVTFNEIPPGFTSYELYVNERFWKAGTLPGVEGWVNEAIQDVPPGQQVIRVCYVNADNQMSRFSKVLLNN